MDVSRREFLKTSALAASTSALSGGVLPASKVAEKVFESVIPSWVHATREVLQLFVGPNLDGQALRAFMDISSLAGNHSSSDDPISLANNSAFKILQALEKIEQISPGWLKLIERPIASPSRFDILDDDLNALGSLLMNDPSFHTVRKQINWDEADCRHVGDQNPPDVSPHMLAFRFYETLDELSAILSRKALYRLTTRFKLKGSVGMDVVRTYLSGGFGAVRNHPWYKLKKQLDELSTSTSDKTVESIRKRQELDRRIEECEEKFKKADTRPPSMNDTVKVLTVRSSLRTACGYISQRDDNAVMLVNVDEAGRLDFQLSYRTEGKINSEKLSTDFTTSFINLFSKFNIQLKPNCSYKIHVGGSSPTSLIESLLCISDDVYSPVFISENSLSYLNKNSPKVCLNVWDTPAISI